MNNEFKKLKSNTETRYVLETATGGATSTGAVATTSSALGKVHKREDNILAQEAGKEKDAPKPRNFVAKNAKMGGAGKMKDKSKTIPRKEKHKKPVAESFNGEYDDEAGMAKSNLLTSARAVMGLLKTIKDRDNLPEWGQEKIAKAEMMLVSVWDYLQSQKQMGNDPQVEAYGRYDRRDAYQRDYDSSISGMDRGNNHRDDERHDLDPSDWYIVRDGKMYKTSVYPRQEQEAISRGYSRTRDEAKAKAGQQGVAEGLSKRDQQDVAAIRAAIARLESQLNHPNADKAAIQQSIAHEKKRLALYGQGVAEVAGPEKCWPGHRKVGTKPGTGKNAGKRVNDCEKIGEAVEDRTSYQVAKILSDRGIKYDPAQENELINAISMVLVKELNMSPKQARHLISYDEDFVSDTLGELRAMENSVSEVAPPGWEKTVKAMKKHKDIDNPFALAWSMKNKGYKSHKKESADPYFESLRAKVEELAKK